MKTEVYRGYTIRETFGGWLVIKDGHTICRPSGYEIAKKAIDLLLD